MCNVRMYNKMCNRHNHAFILLNILFVPFSSFFPTIHMNYCKMDGILLSCKKNETFPIATTRMKLEGVMLSGISQKMTNTI